MPPGEHIIELRPIPLLQPYDHQQERLVGTYRSSGEFDHVLFTFGEFVLLSRWSGTFCVENLHTRQPSMMLHLKRVSVKWDSRAPTTHISRRLSQLIYADVPRAISGQPTSRYRRGCPLPSYVPFPALGQPTRGDRWGIRPLPLHWCSSTGVTLPASRDGRNRRWNPRFPNRGSLSWIPPLELSSVTAKTSGNKLWCVRLPNYSRSGCRNGHDSGDSSGYES